MTIEKPHITTSLSGGVLQLPVCRVVTGAEAVEATTGVSPGVINPLPDEVSARKQPSSSSYGW